MVNRLGLTIGRSVRTVAWTKVLLGEFDALIVENHSFRSKYSA